MRSFLRMLSLGLGVIPLCPSPPVFGQAEVVAHGEPDQLYKGIGQPYVPYNLLTKDQEGTPKNNYDYLWGLASEGRYIWCGTGAGVTSTASAQVASGLTDPNSAVESVSTGGIKYRVWEFASSKYPLPPAALKAYFGDWRPPQVFQYDMLTRRLIDRTPVSVSRFSTLGLRSAGVKNGVALLGGPSLYQVGIHLFAFDAQTGEFLGTQYRSEYSNIRRWVDVQGCLYTTVANTIQTDVRGSVLKWTGSRSNPFSFEVVGHLDNEGAYLTGHEGRLYVGTWPSTTAYTYLTSTSLENPPVCGLWMSPRLLPGGLSPLQAKSWQKVWNISQYDPDDVIAVGVAMGAMHSFNGKLYWGTLHFPAAGLKAMQTEYGGIPSSNIALSERSPMIFRGTDLDNPQKATVELLYGNSKEYTYTWNGSAPVNGQINGTWAAVPNRLGKAGLYGTTGFGDNTNRYTWSSEVHKGRLYFGTFDVNALSKIGTAVDLAASGGNPPATDGADVWRFDNHTSPAVAVTRNGFGNTARHGIRNMVSTPFGLFMGTANSANLLTDRTDNLPDGGWELLKLVE